MKTLLRIGTLLLISTTGVSAFGQSIENATIEREEYAVYSAMIVDYAHEETGTMVIANPTSNWAHVTKLKDLRFFFFHGAASPVLSQETLDDFSQRNRSNRWLTPKFEINRKYVLVDFREIKKLAGIDSMDYEWKPFFKEYSESRGYVTLSRVGFNRQMDQALVHAGWYCPGLCGHWSFLLLAKKDGTWKMTGEANRVVS